MVAHAFLLEQESYLYISLKLSTSIFIKQVILSLWASASYLIMGIIITITFMNFLRSEDQIHENY